MELDNSLGHMFSTVEDVPACSGAPTITACLK